MNKILLIMCRSELIMLIPLLVKLIWFSIINPNYSAEDLSKFKPFSILYFLDISTIHPLLIYPLSILNGFELIYCLVVSFSLHEYLKENFQISIKIFFTIYLPALFIWIVIVDFILMYKS